jgi:pimeloyl-ACP methyl ester carboxylesterase
MPLIQLNNISIYYEITGSGEPLLFLHALGSAGADWSLQVPYFSKRYQVITVDLRGHGKSTHEAESYKIVELAKDMVLLLDTLGIKWCHVVGLSLGSFVAFELALDSPQKIKSLTLVGTCPRVSDIGRFYLLFRMLILTLCPMSLVAKVVAWSCFPGKKNREKRQACMNRIASNDKQTYKKVYSEILKFDVKHRLNELQCPVLIIVGAKDSVTTPAHAKELQPLLHAEIEIIPDAGHVVPIDSPLAFNRILDSHLRKYAHRE